MSFFKYIINQIVKISEKKYFTVLFYTALFVLIFSFNFSVPTDPDLGWHIRYGEEIVNHQNILTKDTYSHTYFGKSVVDTEWPIEAITYLTFTHWSFLGIGVFFAIITSLAFLFPVLVIKGNKLIKLSVVITALISVETVLSTGGRPQNISWVLFSFLFVFLLKYRENFRIKYLIPIPFLFLIWANSHPSFMLGLLLLMLFVLLEVLFDFIKDKKLRKLSGFQILLSKRFPLIFITVLSIASTFLRIREPVQKSLDLAKGLLLPYSFAIASSTSGSVRSSISEWLPPVFFDLQGLCFYLSIILSIAIFLAKKMETNDFKNIVITVFYIYFSTLSIRNAPFFFFIYIPIIIIVTKDIKVNIKFRYLLNLLNISVVVFVTIISLNRIIGFLKTYSIIGNSIESYSNIAGYPWKATNYIKENKLKGNIFNNYNWGGYLIWQLPEYPVFIDGRVPGADIYNEYVKVTSLEDGWEKILDKYNVKIIIFSRSSVFEEALKNTNKWQEAYSDESAMVFVKND